MMMMEMKWTQQCKWFAFWWWIPYSSIRIFIYYYVLQIENKSKSSVCVCVCKHHLLKQLSVIQSTTIAFIQCNKTWIWNTFCTTLYFISLLFVVLACTSTNVLRLLWCDDFIFIDNSFRPFGKWVISFATGFPPKDTLLYKHQCKNTHAQHNSKK